MARYQSWEGDAAAGVVFALVVLVALAAVGIWKIAEATLKEIGRIYVENGSRGRTARLLWYVLAGLLGIWLLCGVIGAAVPAAAAACANIAAWGFFAYILSLEVIDWHARRGEPKPGDLGNLDTYIGNLGIRLE